MRKKKYCCNSYAIMCSWFARYSRNMVMYCSLPALIDLNVSLFQIIISYFLKIMSMTHYTYMNNFHVIVNN